MSGKYLLVLGVALTGSVNSAHGSATLSHRYTFDDGTATDSVGAANGSLVGGTISGGQLNTSSGSGTTGQGVSLPAASVTGISGDFTVEQWFTRADTTANWQTLSSFDASTSDANGYILTQVQRADGSNVSSTATAYNGSHDVTGGAMVLDTNPHQIITTYVASTKTMTLYNDGVASTPVVLSTTGLSLAAQTAYIGINNGSPYNDPTFDGSTNDFRIYSGAVTGSQATALYSLGADPSNAAINAALPEPSSVGLLALGASVGLIRRRRVHV